MIEVENYRLGGAEMQADQWLRLTDYASKYRVSISTLRRRIKQGQIKHRMEEGKYLLLDEAPENPEAQMNPTLTGYAPISQAQARVYTQADEDLIAETQAKLDQMRANSITGAGAEAQLDSPDEPIFSSANRLLGELKRAYMNILHEKEELIIQLKEEVSDLKMLVRVLEDDNERMKRILMSQRQPE